MTPKKTIRLYADHPEGGIKAHVVGSFQRHGHTLYVIRPGYDAQGRRRTAWTQVVHDGVPVWEHKLRADLGKVLAKFDDLWRTAIGKNQRLSTDALAQTRQARLRAFKDGQAGVEPAPALTRDGRGDGNLMIG